MYTEPFAQRWAQGLLVLALLKDKLRHILLFSIEN